ncbi:hypothetical protein C7212DRAFT_352644 [Tuber magnatum]|uniref:Nephrocystin 3-like N-terminal domain-containing protein n=1 Tax=Tuber magnatum TaxID=42249 RepID=A0A317SP39_9PEZI|nr:hypothetical protein C7212DRAFT_352644 [Tuber magnatum]
MSSGQSNSPFEDFSSPQRYGPGISSEATRSIQGNFSGNIGDNNIYGTGHISGYEEQRKRVREPVEGTCTWVTEHPKFRDWLGKNASSLLWLSADPGCGKSVIASFLAGHLEAHTNATICYFFFKDDSDQQRSVSFALCAILHQLFKQGKRLIGFAKEEFQAKGDRFTQEVDTLWNILIKAVAKGECGDVIRIMDALDDRPYHNIEGGFGSHATTMRLRGEDEVKAIAADVTRVIDEGVKGLESYWGQPGGLGHLRDLLESSADRTFIWVSLVLEILKDSEDDSPEEFTKIVSTAPQDLAGLYTKILDKSTYLDKARRILHIMNISFKIRRDRRTIKDLRDPPPGFERTVENLCGHFVRIIDSRIYLVHQTAREFLLKGSLPGQGNWQYSLCPKDSNSTLADICISYLSLEGFEDDPLVIEPNRSGEERVIGDYLERYAFLDYATRHWAHHFRDSQDRQMELFESTRLICEVGSKRFLIWLRVQWFNSGSLSRFPKDLTHLMVATWEDINARSERHGTALNIAAVERNEDITRMLLKHNVKADMGTGAYDILRVKMPLALKPLARN